MSCGLSLTAKGGIALGLPQGMPLQSSTTYRLGSRIES